MQNPSQQGLTIIGIELMKHWRQMVEAEPDFDRCDAVNLLLAVKAWVENEARLDWKETISITL